METNLAEVMVKIAHIRELATRGGTRHEAEVAASKMASLLLKHNLTMADIDTHARETGRAVTKDSVTTGRIGWKQMLLYIISKAHMCECINLGNGTMTVVGHEHNLIVARDTFTWLSDIVPDMAETARIVAAGKGDFRTVTDKTKWLNDYKNGFCTGVDDVYRQMRATVRRETSDEQWAIVPVMEQEVAAYYKELFPRTRQSSKKVRLNDAYGSGVRDGRNINLGGQVSGGRGHRAIGE